MEQKQLLDKDGNPLTPERIAEVMKEAFKPMKPLLERCEWEEDEHLYHCWKINAGKHESGREVTGYTNDAGAAQINEAVRKMVEDGKTDGDTQATTANQ